jgi:hypothetical protein
MTSSLVIVGSFYIVCVAAIEAKADPVLLFDAH